MDISLVYGYNRFICKDNYTPKKEFLLYHGKEKNMSYVFKPSGVCSTKVEFDIDNGRLHDVKFTGGCNGNLKGIGRLVEGMEAKDVAEKLRGTICGFKKTSCPDQLAQAIEQVLAQQ